MKFILLFSIYFFSFVVIALVGTFADLDGYSLSGKIYSKIKHTDCGKRIIVFLAFTPFISTVFAGFLTLLLFAELFYCLYLGIIGQ